MVLGNVFFLFYFPSENKSRKSLCIGSFHGRTHYLYVINRSLNNMLTLLIVNMQKSDYLIFLYSTPASGGHSFSGNGYG